MFCYIDQPRSSSFPIGLVKTKSDFIVRSVETGLGRWILVVTVISVDAYSFFGFLRHDLLPWGYRNRYFPVALCCLIVRRPNLEVVTKVLCKNTGIVLVPCCTWKCAPTAISGAVNVSEVPGSHLLWQMSSWWGSSEGHKNYFKDWCLMDS